MEKKLKDRTSALPNFPWSHISAPLFCEVMWMKSSVIWWNEKHFFPLSRSQIEGVSVCQGESKMNEPLAPYQ